LGNELRKRLYYIPTINDLQEVKPKDVEEFVPIVLGDMDYEKEVVNQKLTVLMFDQIVGYIETSVDMGILNLKQAVILHQLYAAREWLTGTIVKLGATAAAVAPCLPDNLRMQTDGFATP